MGAVGLFLIDEATLAFDDGGSDLASIGEGQAGFVLRSVASCSAPGRVEAFVAGEAVLAI